MRVSGWACDVCEKFSEEIPPEWFEVNRFGNSGEDSQLVCSAGCLVKMGTDLIALESPSKPKRKMSPNEDPCPFCGEVPATKAGLATHITRKHPQEAAQ